MQTINPVLDKIYASKQIEDARENLINVFPAATPQIVSDYLYEFIIKYNCNKTLEVGMAYGLSTLSICQAHVDKSFGSHIAIDPFQNKRWKSIGLLNIQRAGLTDKLQFIEESSVMALSQLAKDNEKISLAFIDGSHLFDFTLLEFFYIDMLLENGGIIIFDDLWIQSIRKTVSLVLKNRAYQILPLKAKSSWERRLGRTVSRVMQTQLSWESALKWSRENICILQKQNDDQREWNFYRDF